MNEDPQFDHDCDQCRFLGRYEKHDLYFCDQSGMPTVLARYGNDGWDYTSGVFFAPVYPAVAEAVKRAKDKGWLKGEIY